MSESRTRQVIFSLTLMAIASIVGLIVLAIAGDNSDTTRTGLIGIASLCAGAIGGIYTQKPPTQG